MKRKKLIRNIAIAAVVVVLVVAAILLALALRKDSRGMNYFERNRTVATADGVSVSMIEYALTFDQNINYYAYFGLDASKFTDEQIHNMQENAVKQMLLQKIYTKEAKALGLSLTDEEAQKCRDDAAEQIKSIEENYAESLAKQGSYSKAALDKQMVNYYQQLGMNQSQYLNFLRERSEATAYSTKLEEYYEANGSGLDENELLDYYRGVVKESIDAYAELDDEQKKDYFSGMMKSYKESGSGPILFVPEGFIYIDYIKLEKDTPEEITGIIEKVNSGELSFDDLLMSEDNKDPYANTLVLPYAIGENDHSYLFESDKAYGIAAALEIGEIGSFADIEEETEATEPTDEETDATEPADEETDATEPASGETDAEETATGEDAASGETEAKVYTGYIFRRAEGKMCEEGESGIISIDYYPGIRESAENELREEKWFSDAKYEDAIYAYKGALG